MSNNVNTLSIRDIMSLKIADMSEAERGALPRDFVDYSPKLYKSLALPSYVHGYSLAIEFMKNWFLENLPKDYFKVVHINGKHVLDDWKHFNNYNIKREKPMLAIIPTVDYDFDRDNLDMYGADQNIFLKKSKYQQSFLKDYDNMAFLYMQMRALRMNFTFRARVNSRSEQLDLYNRMELCFRIGATQHREISADFHIPPEIIANIASAVGFDINPKTHRLNDKDIIDFLHYVNKHSDLPIMYKMRAINQKPEFFVRVKDLYTHISTKDKLVMDDGEREGTLDTNFNIEMNAVLTIPIPHFFVYFNQKPLVEHIEVNEPDKNTIGIYTINTFEIPPKNSLGWGQVAITDYAADANEESIDISSILKGSGNVSKVIDSSVALGINPSAFMDVQLFHSLDKSMKINITMDFENSIIHIINPPEESEVLHIAIYADKDYINNAMINMENYHDDRIRSRYEYPEDPTNKIVKE